MKVFKYFLGTLFVYALFFGWMGFESLWRGTVKLTAESPEYYRDEIIRVKLYTRNQELMHKWESLPPKVEVLFNGTPVKGIGGLEGPYMRYDKAAGMWTGIWPCPWNAPVGRYDLRLAGYEGDRKLLREGFFAVKSRVPAKVPPKLSVLTYETDPPSESLKIHSPSGEVKNWKALVDWVQYARADAFWILVGKTTGVNGEIWNRYNSSVIRQIGQECHRRGILFGVWAMCYMTHPDREPLKRYEYAMDIKDGGVVPTRAVSLRDPNRPSDIARLLSGYARMPEVDFIGLDYIRNALGGYELAEDFYRDMPWIRKPEGWDKMNQREKIAAFARLKIPRKDKELIDAWQWWRAHKVGEIVRRIRSEAGTDKPLWTFTLGWEKGWQHGQDPVAIVDAGSDIDAIMLYEADKEQFSTMMTDWSSYIKKGDTRVIVGDIVDAPLHQGEGVEEFKRRMRAAMRGIYSDGPADGIFVHDLARALWGRKGGFSTQEWMSAAREIITEFKSGK